MPGTQAKWTEMSGISWWQTDRTAMILENIDLDNPSPWYISPLNKYEAMVESPMIYAVLFSVHSKSTLLTTPSRTSAA